MGSVFTASLFDDTPGDDDLRMREFCRHVSTQEDFDLPILDSGTEIDSLVDFVNRFDEGEPYGEISDDDIGAELSSIFESDGVTPRSLIVHSLLGDDQTFDNLRQILALTETRVSLDLSYEVRREGVCDCGAYELTNHSYDSLRNKLTADWGVSPSDAIAYAETYADYFIETKDVVAVLDTLASLTEEEFELLVKRVILPSEQRHQSAKLRGHEAERMVAAPLLDVGVPMLPEDKDENPRSGDVNLEVNGYNVVDGSDEDKDIDSYDLLIENPDGAHAVGVVSMIHTSILGQYGSDKADKAEEYATNVAEYNERADADMELWLLVDGAGFTENNYLTDVCEPADGFCQLSTAFKLWARLNERGLVDIQTMSFDETFYTDAELDELRDWAGDRGIPTGMDCDGESYDFGSSTVVVATDE